MCPSPGGWETKEICPPTVTLQGFPVVKSEDTLYPVCSWGTPGLGTLDDEVFLQWGLACTVHASASQGQFETYRARLKGGPQVA